MKRKVITAIAFISFLVLFLSYLMLVLGDVLDANYNVIGIRIAALVLSFASFLSSTTFSLLVYYHNRTVSRINDDTNRRAEMFRNLQFASSNYSIIEFLERMKITRESKRYVDRLFTRKNAQFHMIETGITMEDVYQHPENYGFVTLRIPFRLIEGKTVSNITIDKLTFERNHEKFYFIDANNEPSSRVFILYNEKTQRNNVITNLIYRKDSDFFKPSTVNDFSKIKLRINITSILGVRVKGISELYFTNPDQSEGDGSNTYRINSSNFTLIEHPTIVHHDLMIE